MKISVNLSAFFSDHRTIAWLFVNEKTKCIKDIEDRISQIFGIHNFYLTHEGQYLPSLEDVGILSEIDVVWVTPHAEDEELNIASKISDERKKKKKKTVSEDSKVINHKRKYADGDSDNEYVPKPKKKKRKNLEQNDDSTLSINKNEKSEKRKKSKTKKLSELFNNVDNSDKDSTVSINKNEKSEKRKKSKRKEKLLELFENVEDNSDEDLFNKNQNNKTDNEGKCINVKSVATQKESFAEQLSKMLVSCDKIKERPINIIKTIIMSKNQSDNLEPGSSTNYEDSKLKNKGSDSLEENLDGEFSSEIKEVSDHDQSTIEHKHKRKRKRSRVKKRKILTFDSPLAQEIPTSSTFTTENNNARHIRFTNEEVAEENSVCETHDGNSEVEDKKSVELSEECHHSPKIVLTETESPHQISLSNEQTAVENGVCEMHSEENSEVDNTSTANPGLSEEFILKQPLTPNISPVLGDIIAFKILRMNENYAPEVSSYIVGKVINSNPESKEVTFDISYGLEQCSEPQGKFSLISEDELLEGKNTVQEFTWTNLLEPRLLFP